MSTVREKNLAWLSKRDFVVANSLPTKGPSELRPIVEIARRAMAIDAVFTWVTGQGVEDAKVRAYAERNDLERAMALDERTMFRAIRKRAHANIDRIGRFYCCHNAVRSAQLGGKTVPDGFHPVMNGGVIHERRHALTWCLSPGVAWDDTDLST